MNEKKSQPKSEKAIISKYLHSTRNSRDQHTNFIEVPQSFRSNFFNQPTEEKM